MANRKVTTDAPKPGVETADQKPTFVLIDNFDGLHGEYTTEADLLAEVTSLMERGGRPASKLIVLEVSRKYRIGANPVLLKTDMADPVWSSNRR